MGKDAPAAKAGLSIGALQGASSSPDLQRGIELMRPHASTSSTVVRFPPRLRVVSVQTEPKSALEALLSAGTIDDRQHVRLALTAACDIVSIGGHDGNGWSSSLLVGPPS